MRGPPGIGRAGCWDVHTYTHIQVVQTLVKLGVRGIAGQLGRLVLEGLKGTPANSTKVSLQDMPYTQKRVRDLQAILSAEIDWNAPELQTLSPSARDFLERLLQVGFNWVGGV